MEDSKKEVYNQLHQNQNQFVYLLLAIDVSSIGFAINRSIEMQLSWNQILLGLAILCWAISFLCGCNFIEIKSKSFGGNLKMFNQPSKIPLWQSYLDKNNKIGIKNYKRVKNYLYIGVVLFLIWYVIEIINN